MATAGAVPERARGRVGVMETPAQDYTRKLLANSPSID